MTSPQLALNLATIRAERRAARRVWTAVLAAACLSAAGLLLASMALHLAVTLPDLVAQAVAERGM